MADRDAVATKELANDHHRSEPQMRRKRAANRREDWLGRMRQAIGVATSDAVLLELLERSVQQAFIETRDEDPSEDIAVEAMANLLREIRENPELLNDAQRLEGRRYQHTYTRISAWRRKNKRAKAGAERYALHVAENGPTYAPEVRLPDSRHARLEAALAICTPDEQEAVLLLRAYEMKPRDACDIIGASVEVVKKRAQRAMKKLRDAFGLNSKKSPAPASAKELT